jgi:two-component system sensor histidine kinase TctE
MKAALSLRPLSLRRHLLLGILVPVLALIVLNGLSLYGSALAALNTAYDRTLLASAKVIGEQLDVDGYDAAARLRATVPYSALEAFEADTRTRMVYRVSNLDGAMVSGYADLPFWRGQLPPRPPYAALVDFYDDVYAGSEVRVAVLLQPVASARGRGMAVVQVAETLELRRALARRILLDTLWRQAVLVAVIGFVVVGVVQRATRPVRRLSDELRGRPEEDLTPIATAGVPREVLPLVDATNSVMARLAQLLDNQKRFVRDTAHQLRTPLAVLKTQVQSALRGDVEPTQALREVNATVERATLLANQMLSLAKVEQLRQQAGSAVTDLAQEVRAVALELAPLIAEKDIDFEIATAPAGVRAHEWMLRELSRNLLHNAVKQVPPGGTLAVRVAQEDGHAVLQVRDSGPGIGPELRARLFQPFSAGDVRGGSGLGLAICREIVRALHGAISLENREIQGHVAGLDATVRLPLAHNEP